MTKFKVVFEYARHSKFDFHKSLKMNDKTKTKIFSLPKLSRNTLAPPCRSVGNRSNDGRNMIFFVDITVVCF